MIRTLFIWFFGHPPLSREEARDWSAILYTPAINICAIGLALNLMFGSWSQASEEARVMYLGLTLIGSQILIGLGTLFLQRRTANIKVETPAGSFEIDDVTKG